MLDLLRLVLCLVTGLLRPHRCLVNGFEGKGYFDEFLVRGFLDPRYALDLAPKTFLSPIESQTTRGPGRQLPNTCIVVEAT